MSASRFGAVDESLTHLSYICRANPRDAQRHVVVGVQTYKPLDFARQMNVSLANGWGIVRTIADLALKQPEGKYVLVKDPNNVSRVVSEGRARADGLTAYHSAVQSAVRRV